MDRNDRSSLISDPERTQCDDLLARWQVGAIDPWDVVLTAEALEEQHLATREHITIEDGIMMIVALERSDPRSMAEVVLELLAIAHLARVLPEDIPVMRKFLRTPPGDEEAAWQTFDAYWDAIDYDAREQRVHELFFSNR